MRKFFISFFVGLIFLITPTLVQAATWKPITPEGYTPITWAKATGIASFFKAPSGNGNLDFITRIYLPQNQIQFIAATSSAPLDWGPADPNFTTPIIIKESTPTAVIPTTTQNPDEPFPNTEISSSTASVTTPMAVISPYRNFAFTRFVAETGKTAARDAKFVWNGPFFNVTLSTSDLSMALKYTVGTTTLISSGSRPTFDVANSRRMLLINNRTGRANVQEFDADIFVSDVSGDQAFESFAPEIVKGDSSSARLFVGVMPSKQEIVIYCSQSATAAEASRALSLAGVPPENQLQADGGGSASCGYNMPGQYFVEPSRTIPLMMGAATILARGVPTTDGLNVRSGPGPKFGIIFKLKKTDTVRVFEEKSGWYRIGIGQWVSKSLIKKQ
ncbi:MAG: hypothetical protein A2534_00875 [Candidatus Magasanikbacteria bacterium RIFOXYD2_FULL_39_9]|uniref:SH3b domain-containing protein n=1 Tax=Candidatus Magasanikbacteria bacterium RIFOXYD1_FULL_40_23 TaxID=1798705 RepID=A0A1F6P7J4_9BACT|nr:MAG: hypothetical protein A2563_01025 [Candidatus Magasanikbacteria bacterium RIFOXYD1_FULL_40_23]OGH93538.1 MAG: hypothetical protein A2534_00875 [Candidatus Magasanikbacteria bacterium RIFOXYD2_FULL_39_9]